ncbi:hypothetical protein [Klebsiella oxytoca]|uniref:Uncharacterized protein n=1 Tax=Klebsiella oxytoca TaxID=571 RepID=A0AAD3UQD8_KLEOX|nr:hypothetical protein [Klebsiella oxytoca]MBL6088527.1 hypothetical protein [Klebsiella oxytoca]MBL6253154.1 hypothetical protein [Klebsiella oxytoca]MBL6274507.1 hypothetical protein [Klebsiella oxytoca]MDU2891111.1 hypothetical protein [Klebsiella oxytoca]MEC6026008.1 hypothetical protein [Klebsiella oxytoca]
MDKCQGIFGKIFGHSFRVAITKGAPSMNLKAAETGISSILQMMETSSQKPITESTVNAAGSLSMTQRRR